MAAKYYQKATIIAPSYDYGWFNYSYAETQLGNKAKSKQIANKALTVLPKTDPLYKYIQLLSQGKL
jgi:tetratricopeptide (TPR) repeat protein